MEVSELLSWAVLDTSGIASGSSTPKRPGFLALATPLLLKPEDSAKLVDTSCQVSAPEDAEMDDPMLEEIYAFLPPLVETLRLNREAPSVDVAQAQDVAQNWDEETHWTVLISEAKVRHTACLKEIEDDCSLALAEV